MTMALEIPHSTTVLADLGLLKVSGRDAKKFLQGQLTCQLDDITPQQSRLGAHCNPQGRIVSFFRLFLFQDSYYLQMPLDLLPIAAAALQKYAVFFQTTISDASTALQQLGCIGDRVADFATLPQQTDAVISLDQGIMIKLPGKLPRYVIISEPGSYASLSPSLPYSAWKVLEIRTGIAQIHPETTGKFLPHELNLPALQAVSFNKGCYTGQEIIARMQYRGKLKKHLVVARAHTELTPVLGNPIYLTETTEACGTVVDYCQEDPSTYLLLVLAEEQDTTAKKLSLHPQQKAVLEFLNEN